MTISYQNTQRDRVAFLTYQLPRTPLIVIVATVAFLLVTFGSVIPAIRDTTDDIPMYGKVIGFIVCELMIAVFIVGFMTVFALLSLISRRNQTLFCKRKLTLGDDTFCGESEYGKSENQWTMVQKVARTRKHIFMYTAQDMAVVVPRRAFKDSVEWDAFYEMCLLRTKLARNPIAGK